MLHPAAVSLDAENETLSVSNKTTCGDVKNPTSVHGTIVRFDIRITVMLAGRQCQLHYTGCEV